MHPEEFKISGARINFCNSYTTNGGEIIFGSPYRTLSDYKNDRMISSYSGLNSSGLRIQKNDSKNKYDEDFFVNSLLTLRAQGDPITIGRKDDKLRYCIILEDNDGNQAILDNWNSVVMAHASKMLLNFYNVLERKTNHAREGATLIETLTNNVTKKIIAEYHFDDPGNLYALFYSSDGINKTKLEKAFAELDISVNYSPAKDPLDVGLFSYGDNKNKDSITSTPIPKSDLIEIRFNYAWNKERSLTQNLREFVWNTKRIAAYIDGVTDARLRVDATEKVLIAENPSFADEMFCRLIIKGDREKCKEFLKYRLPLSPIVDTEWNRNIDYKHWLNVTRRVLNENNNKQIDIDQILVKELPFYDQPKKPRYLVEVSDTNYSDGRYYFISNETGKHTWWLDGTANPIIEHNKEYGFAIRNANQAIGYLKFFNSSLALAGAPVYILDLENNRFPGLKTGESKPPEVVSKAKESWKIFAHYVLGPIFAASTFTVTTKGAVTMDDNQSGWLKDSGIILDKLVYIEKSGLRRWCDYEIFMKDFSLKSGKKQSN